MTQENNNYFFFFGLTLRLEGSQFPNQGSNPCPLHSLNLWPSREVPISYSVKVTLNSQVCRNNFLKYTLTYYFTSFNTKNENYLGQELKLLLSRKYMQFKNMYKHFKESLSCIYLYTILTPDPWKGQREHKRQASSWICNLVIYLKFLFGSTVKEDQTFKNCRF